MLLPPHVRKQQAERAAVNLTLSRKKSTINNKRQNTCKLMWRVTEVHLLSVKMKLGSGYFKTDMTICPRVDGEIKMDLVLL